MSTLPAGITPAGSGKVGSQDVKWNILGHVYWLKAESDDCFAFETLDPPGTFVPPHVHPAQDEFIYMLEGTFDLYLAGSWTRRARATSCACRAASRMDTTIAAKNRLAPYSG